MLIADPGLGKTTLLRHFERRLNSRGRTLFLSPTHDNASEILRNVLSELGTQAEGGDLPAMRARIDEVLTAVGDTHGCVVLIVDYALNAEPSALETIRLLSTLESLKKGLLKIIIAGSVGLADQLNNSECANEIQSISIAPLRFAEVEGYINHRLRTVGWRGNPLFTANAYGLIGERSSGIPTRINEVCFKALQTRAEWETWRIDAPNDDRDCMVDEHCVDTVMPVRQPLEPTSGHSAKHRIALIASLFLILVLATVGLWYHDTTRTRTRNDVVAATAASALRPSDFAVTQGLSARRSANDLPAVVIEPPNPAENEVAARSRSEAASPDRNLVSAPLPMNVTPDRTAASSPTSGKREGAHKVKPAPGSGGDAARAGAETATFEIKLGDAYMRVGDYDKAIQSFLSALAFAPGNKEAEQKVERARRAKTVENNTLQ